MAKHSNSPGAVHIVLQGKGGVGKSLIASTLMQHLQHASGRDQVRGIDTDPSNQTFAGYQRLQVRQLPILLEGTSRVDEGKFDQLVQWLMEDTAETVIDTGATSFLPFSNYLVENAILELLRAQGRTVRVHTVIAGGAALADTIDGFRSLAKPLPERSMVVWLNEFFGPVSSQGKTFEEARAYLDSADKVIGIVRWSACNPDTFGRDMRELQQRHWTFDQAIDEPTLNIVQRQRLKIVRDELFAQLSALPQLSTEAPVATLP